MHNKQERDYDMRFKGYVINTCITFHDADVDDMIQDGYLIFNKCNEKYPDVNIKHFMSLFKSSFARHYYTLHRRKKKRITLAIPEGIATNHIFPELSNQAQQVLDTFSQDYKLHMFSKSMNKKMKEKFGISLKNLQNELLEIV